MVLAICNQFFTKVSFFHRLSMAFVLWVLPKALGAQEASHGSPQINWWGLGAQYAEAPAIGWLLLTFFIFVWGLMWAVRKPLSIYLETRSKDIQKGIEEGKRAKAESEAKLREYEERLLALDRDLAIMKETYVKQGKNTEAELEQTAQMLKRRILKDTEETILAAVKQAKNRLTVEVVEEALKRTKEKLTQSQGEGLERQYSEEMLAFLKASRRSTT